jgi:hypothetical protein
MFSQKPTEPESLPCECQASKRLKIEIDQLKQEPTTIASLSRQAASKASQQLIEEKVQLKQEPTTIASLLRQVKSVLSNRFAAERKEETHGADD